MPATAIPPRRGEATQTGALCGRRILHRAPSRAPPRHTRRAMQVLPAPEKMQTPPRPRLLCTGPRRPCRRLKGKQTRRALLRRGGTVRQPRPPQASPLPRRQHRPGLRGTGVRQRCECEPHSHSHAPLLARTAAPPGPEAACRLCELHAPWKCWSPRHGFAQGERSSAAAQAVWQQQLRLRSGGATACEVSAGVRRSQSTRGVGQLRVAAGSVVARHGRGMGCHEAVMSRRVAECARSSSPRTARHAR